MQRPIQWTIGSAGVVGLLALLLLVFPVASCITAPEPFPVQGPSQVGNEPPTLEITEPVTNITRGRGDPFLIRWADSDRDSGATISFSLVNTATNATILLVEGLDENDSTGPEAQLVGTGLIPLGTYNLLGTIADEDSVVDQYAVTTGASSQRVLVTIVEEGSGPPTTPPILTVTAPAFNLSVAQNDELVVRVQPSALPPAVTTPFDPDSPLRLYLVLDLDNDPDNDDPANPDPSQIIVLETRNLAPGVFEEQVFTEIIDLALVPARPEGEPYFIRITADDGTNPRVHRYAVGTINVVLLAADTVDLAEVGRTLSGARFYGFNPGANVGSDVVHLGDFDLDNVDDFVLVAQFGNPQNSGPVGEAYLIYGRGNLRCSGGPQANRACVTNTDCPSGTCMIAPGVRLGGSISVNSISQTVSGAVFHAPPIRDPAFGDPNPRTDGITDVSLIPDLSGDGRPEIIFGLPHVHGAFDGTDYDPDDQDPLVLGCYPDFLVNNYNDGGDGIADSGFFAGGMAVLVNSQNRDREGFVNPDRLESTAVDLELAGQPPVVLDPGGVSVSGGIFPRAHNFEVEPIGTDTSEQGRIAGARFITGGFEYIIPGAPPREDLFGQNVAALGDLNSDNLAEIIVSAPRNERYLADLLANTPAGFVNPILASTSFVGSIVVFPGENYNDPEDRDQNDEGGAGVTPFLDHHAIAPFGTCQDPVVGRHFIIPAETFEIFAEDIDDFLGGGRSAGDFNLDGLDDILCGAPLNDRSSSRRDSGTTYVIYGRTVFGEVRLRDADNVSLRPPMLRIMGFSAGDEIGRRQTAGLDVNGDRIDDVFIGSAQTDFGGVTRSTCAGDFNGDGSISFNDLREVSFEDCRLAFGDEVFSNDSCKAFDYDNDGDIDDADRCVFCCLSGDCDPESDCVHGRDPTDCCANLVDNGFAGIVFGGRFIDGDRDITQLASTDLPGTVFFGGGAQHRAGVDVSSAGDFNKDGFGDILIATPGEIRRDSAGRQRLGVVYLVFGGTHLQNTTWNLSDPERGVGSAELPGIVFLSPYVKNRPNEAAPITAAAIGDINHDGFGDILIGNPKADFIDLTFPQGPDAPGSDPSAGRRSDAGDAYIVYGNNFGSNRTTP